MKRSIIYLFIIAAISFASCKGNNKGSNAADTGQTHVGNTGPADSSSYAATPTETGGKDSSGNGSGNTNTVKDTIKTSPK